MIDGKAILAEVKANLAKLDNCAGPHDFQPEPTPRLKLFPRMVCNKCGGVVSRTDWIWYQRGLKHGKLA